MNLENPLLQGIQPTAGAPAGVLLAETDPSGQAGSRLTSIPGLITQAAGPPNGSTPTVPPQYIDTSTGVLYWWDGAAWLRQEIVFPVDNVNSLTLLSTPINGALYQTKGYYIHEDGGANLYRYVGNSIQACDGLFILDGIGGDNAPGAAAAAYPGTGTGRFIATDQSVAHAGKAGAVGDGVADDTFRIQAALDSAAKNIDLGDGDYLIGAGLTVTGKTISIYGDNAILRQGHATSAPTLKLETSNNSVVSGITFAGSDTPATYDSVFAALSIGIDYINYSGILARQSNDVTIENCVASSRIVGFALDECESAIVRGCRVLAGFGTSTSSATNLHPGTTFHDCHNCSIVDYRAEDYGSGVLAASACTNITSQRCTVLRSTDNGIYYSTASSSQVLNCYIDGEGLLMGGGVKVRGSRALISGVIVKDTVVGITLAGNVNESPAGSGFGGWGYRVENCVVEGTANYGLDFGTLGGGTLYLRDVVVSNCIFQNCLINGGASAGVIHGPVEYSTFSDIHINGSGSYGVFMDGTGGSPNPKAVTFENIVISNTADMGFRLVDFQDGTIRNVKISNCAVTDAFRLFSCSRMFVYDIWSDSGRLFDDATSDNNRYYNIKTAAAPAYSGALVVRDGVRRGSLTYNPAPLADGASVTATLTVLGALLGEHVMATFSLDLQGVTIYAWVSAADTVKVRFHNTTGAPVDLASGTIIARVEKP